MRAELRRDRPHGLELADSGADKEPLVRALPGEQQPTAVGRPDHVAEPSQTLEDQASAARMDQHDLALSPRRIPPDQRERVAPPRGCHVDSSRWSDDETLSATARIEDAYRP